MEVLKVQSGTGEIVQISKLIGDSTLAAMFGPCTAGLKRDCVHQVCLARHIDDPPQLNN